MIKPLALREEVKWDMALRLQRLFNSASGACGAAPRFDVPVRTISILRVSEPRMRPARWRFPNNLSDSLVARGRYYNESVFRAISGCHFADSTRRCAAKSLTED